MLVDKNVKCENCYFCNLAHNGYGYHYFCCVDCYIDDDVTAFQDIVHPDDYCKYFKPVR